MSLFEAKPDIVSERHVLTQYPVEEITITWKVTNFSKIFNIVRYEFQTCSCSTKFEFQLKRYSISLHMYDDGSSMKVHFKCLLFTNRETNMSSASNQLLDKYNSISIMQLLPTHFENDVFNFKCTLQLIGYSITNEVKSYNSEISNLKKLSCNMRDFFEKQEHCDLTITVGADKIQVHKSILCARSPVFSKMFQCAMLESESKEIEINDIHIDVLKDFLLFLYSGELEELNWNSALHLYYAADKYDIVTLRETCSEFLGLNVKVDNVCDVLKLADMHNDKKLKKYAINYAQIHSSEVKLTDIWKEFLSTHPRLALEIFK